VVSGNVVLALLVAVAAAGRVQSVLVQRRLEQLRHGATRDEATGMYVVGAGRVRLGAELSRAQRTGVPVQLRRGVVVDEPELVAVARALPAGSVAVRSGAKTWIAAVPVAEGSDLAGMPGYVAREVPPTDAPAARRAAIDDLLGPEGTAEGDDRAAVD
jgi:hypothetical protein